jgi:hypothetical protein
VQHFPENRSGLEQAKIVVRFLQREQSVVGIWRALRATELADGIFAKDGTQE